MAQLTHEQYDALERAIIDKRRIVVYRKGTEFIVTPERFRTIAGREVVDAAHPTTGEPISFYVDELDAIEVVT